MKPNSRNILTVIAGLAILSVLVSACSSDADATELPTTEVAEHAEDEHVDAEPHEDEHPPEQHMEGAHDVPDEAAAVPNPFSVDDESLAAGSVLYASNCAICHGETGEGDGPAASGLDTAPSDLHEGHVQENTDGALFYIISHGKPETPMPAWEDVLDEDERWHVVNFMRTFQVD